MCTAAADQHPRTVQSAHTAKEEDIYSPKIYGYGVAVVCAVIAVAPRICRGGHRG